MSQTQAQLVDYGTAVASSVPTNGPYLSAANTVAISTNGTGRLFVDSTGRIGVGTSSPGGNLDVRGLSGTTIIRAVGADASGNADVEIFSTGTSGNSRLYFSDTAAQSGSIIYTHASNTLSLATNATTAVTIDSSQRVGIGTTTPVGDGTAVHIHGTTYSTLHLTNGTTGQAASDGFEIVTDGSTAGDVIIRNRETGNLIVQNAGNEAFRVDSSRRLLVGTSTARSNFFNTSGFNGNLQVESVTGNGNRVVSHVYNSNDDGSPLFVLGKTRSTTIGGNTVVSNNDQLGLISFQGADGSELVEAARIDVFVDGPPGANDMPGRLVFSTTADGASSPTERMRISSTGSVLFQNKIINSGQGSVFQSVTNSVDQLYMLSSGTGAATLQLFGNANGSIGSITTSGSSTAFNTSSDYRLKENVTAVLDGITRLQQLKPSRFNFIADPDCTVDGFIAHEVQEVVPEAITGEKDAVDDDGNPIYQGIDQSKLVPLLTAALQELVAEVESLKAEVAALKAQ